MNWDDLRVVLAIGQEASLAGAARRVKVDQTTVARRLRALERSLGAALFERLDGHWRPTPVGALVLERATRIEEDMAGLARIADSANQAVVGSVRLTAVGTLIDWIAPDLDQLYTRHPGLELELVASNTNLSVARREADIAIRLARPASGDFLIQKLADIGFAMYANPASAAGSDDWLCYTDDLADTPEMRWLAPHLEGGRVRLRSNSLGTLQRAAAQGIGQALLPCFVGDASPELRRHSGPTPVLTRELWQLIHPTARRQARVAAVAAWLVEYFGKRRGELAG